MASEKHEKNRAFQIKQAEPYTNHQPTDPSVRSAWIYVSRQERQEDYPPNGENSGKWLVFVPTEQVDEIWAKIKKAVENGLLGNIAKVAPIHRARKDKFTGKQRQVICVYTYDWTDEKDVMRIREELKNLGLIEKLSYKSDADTRAGKYRHKGDKNISKYQV